MASAARCICVGTAAGAMGCCGCWGGIWNCGGLAGVFTYAPGPGRWGVAGGMFAAMVGGWGARREQLRW